MQQMLDRHLLSLSEYRQVGAVPKSTPELRRLIRDHGIVDPVVVRPKLDQPGRYEILSNPESYIEAGKLGIEQIPVVIRDDLDEQSAAEIVRAHYQHAKSNPIDEAEWFEEKLAEQRAVHDGKRNIARLARLTGNSRSYLSRSLALLSLPDEVQEYFRRGDLSAAHGRFLCKLKSVAEQKRLAARAVKQKLSVRDLDAIVNTRKALAAATVSEPSTKDPDIVRLERQLSESIGCPVTIDHAAGRLSIQYFGNHDTLEGVLDKLL